MTPALKAKVGAKRPRHPPHLLTYPGHYTTGRSHPPHAMGVLQDECYICFEPCNTKSPCNCKMIVHTKCLQEYMDFNKCTACSICQNSFSSSFPEYPMNTSYKIDDEVNVKLSSSGGSWWKGSGFLKELPCAKNDMCFLVDFPSTRSRGWYEADDIRKVQMEYR